MSTSDGQRPLIHSGLTRLVVGRDHRPGCEQPVQAAFYGDQLQEELVEGGWYGDSQQIIGAIWSTTVVGEAAKMVK